MNLSEFPSAPASYLAEIIAASSYALGQVTGTLSASERIRTAAGRAFENGKDDNAHLLRIQADNLADAAKKARSDYEEDSRPRRDAAFAELARREAAAGESGV